MANDFLPFEISKHIFYESVEWSRAKELRKMKKEKWNRASGKCVTIAAGEKVLYERRKQRSTKANKINDASIPQVLPLAAAGTHTHRSYSFSVRPPVSAPRRVSKVFLLLHWIPSGDIAMPLVREFVFSHWRFLCSFRRCLCAHFVNVNNNNGRLLWVSLKLLFPMCTCSSTKVTDRYDYRSIMRIVSLWLSKKFFPRINRKTLIPVSWRWNVTRLFRFILSHISQEGI